MTSSFSILMGIVFYPHQNANFQSSKFTNREREKNKLNNFPWNQGYLSVYETWSKNVMSLWVYIRILFQSKWPDFKIYGLKSGHISGKKWAELFYLQKGADWRNAVVYENDSTHNSTTFIRTSSANKHFLHDASIVQGF